MTPCKWCKSTEPVPGCPVCGDGTHDADYDPLDPLTDSTQPAK